MTKKNNSILLLLFLGFLGGFFLLNLFCPDKAMSEQENRYLRTLPDFSFSSLIQGEFIPELEDYCSDQFVGRDQWISLKARLEIAQGKSSNNHVYLTRDGRLMTPFSMPEPSSLDARITLLETMQEQTGLPVMLGLIPGSAALYGDQLPNGANTDAQDAIIRYVYDRTSLETADLFSMLSNHQDEYIFYRTDHHWTSLGAFYAYETLGDALQYTARGKDSFSPRRVSNEFFGTFYSSSGITWIEPDAIDVWCPEPEGLNVTRCEGDTEEMIPLYHEEKLQFKDKYSFFLGGNAPLVVLDTAQPGPSLLILRDSYADSLVPFLTEHFSEIHLIDLRYFRDSLSAYAAENGIDQILVLYGVDNFCSETSLALMIG